MPFSVDVLWSGPGSPEVGAAALLALGTCVGPTLAVGCGGRDTDSHWSLAGSLPGASAAVCAGSAVCVSGRLSCRQPAAHGGAGDDNGSLRGCGPLEEGKADSPLQLVSSRRRRSCLLSVSSLGEFQAWGRLD